MKPHPWPALLALALILVPQSSFARRPAGTAAVGATVEIDFGKDVIQPTPAQTAAIRRAAADPIAELAHPERTGYAVATADLNDDGRPDLIVQFDDIAFCGSAGCSGVIVLATPQGFATTTIGLPNFGRTLTVLPATHHGMHDLQYDGDSPIWRWDGTRYRVDAGVAGPGAPPWATRSVAGRAMAMAVAIDSTIKSLSVFCDQQRPMLAMLLKLRPPVAPVTLSFLFRGWVVNLPMRQGSGDGLLWFGDLSGSDLPLWFAHRGTSATTRELAALADQAYLRINGTTQGEISLQGSAAATQAALGACH